MKAQLIAIVLLFAGGSLFAQPEDHEDRKKKMDAMRIGFITDALELTSEEAQVFWPVFNEMNAKIDEKRKAIRDEVMSMRKNDKGIDDLSDSKLQEMMLNELQNEADIVEIKKEYHQKFIDTVGVKKTAKLYKSEHDFRKELFRKSKGHGQKEKGAGGPHH